MVEDVLVNELRRDVEKGEEVVELTGQKPDLADSSDRRLVVELAPAIGLEPETQDPLDVVRAEVRHHHRRQAERLAALGECSHRHPGKRDRREVVSAAAAADVPARSLGEAGAY